MSITFCLRKASLVACLAATPALADHPVQSFGGQSAGPINIISAATMPTGSFSLSASSSFTMTDRFSGRRLTQLAGNHIHAHGTDWTGTASLGASYGVADGFTLSVNIPYVHRRAVRSGSHAHGPGGVVNSAEYHGDSRGPGDAALLGKRRIWARDGAQASVLLGFKPPTGRTDASHEGERLEAEHQPGSGSWDALWGAAASAPVAGSVAFGASFLHTVATKGAYNANLGDRLQYGMGLSYRMGGDRHAHGHGHDHRHTAWDAILELNGEWAGRQRVNGETDEDSGGNIIFLSPGIRFAPGGAWSAHASLGAPVFSNTGRGHPETAFRVVSGIAKNF